MSRIGRKPITVPAGVTVELNGQNVKVTGPKGTLELIILPGIKIEQDGSTLNVSKVVETPETGRLYGLMRTLVDNMVIGVSAGFTRALEINGDGIRAAAARNTLTLSIAFSHPFSFTLP